MIKKKEAFPLNALSLFQKEKMECLDYLRVISVVMIVCCHFSCVFSQYSISGFSNYFLQLANTTTGKLGVQLFFLLSGSTLILNHNEDFSYKKFYWKRWKNIFPLLYICWFAFYLIKVVQTGIAFYNGNPFRIIWTLLGMDYYLGGMTPTYAIVGEWFTGAIIILYFLFPLFRLLYRRQTTYYLTFTVLLALFLIDTYRYPLPHVAQTESIFQDMFYFWVGMMLIHEQERLKKFSPLLLISVLMVLLVVPVSMAENVVCFAIALTIYLSVLKIPNGTVFAGSKIISFFKKYSYAVYLLHHQIIYLVMGRFAGGYLPIYKSFILYVLIWALIVVSSVIAIRVQDLIFAAFYLNKKTQSTYTQN